jgi:diguanylate cyclase (GGDEF)-like protein
MYLYRQLMAAATSGTRSAYGNDFDELGRIIRRVEQMAQIGFWRLDLADDSLDWSEQVFAIHDMEYGPVPDVDKALSFYPLYDRQRLMRALDGAINDGIAYDLELDFTSACGKTKRVRALGDPQFRDGRISAIVGAFQDVSASHEIERRLEKASLTDDLTELPNRRHFTRRFERLSSDRFRPFALALFDLDHFKQINDGYGHKAGDEMLRAAAQAMRQPWLRSSFAARLGGDEFVVLFTDADMVAEIGDTTERLVDALRLDMMFRSKPLSVTGTVGVAAIDTPGYSLSEVLSCADAALYAAKANGRGTATISSPEDMFFGSAAA